jgi:hypothetical protein
MSERVFVDVVEVVFCGGGEEVAELKVVEGAAVCEICVAEFVECVDLAWVVGLRREVRSGGGWGWGRYGVLCWW